MGWTDRVGVSDSGNQFHYYRLTPDDRILWGGYDAIYHFGRSVEARHEDRDRTYATLAEHFFETFPQLAGTRFTHRWAGVIDTCTRFCAFYGVTRGRRIAYATGFTGLGVGASRFAADVMLDLLAGESTERTRTRMVREKPLPFPPEPLAGSASSSPAGPWPGRTPPAAGTCGCGCSTGSVSGSTPDPGTRWSKITRSWSWIVPRKPRRLVACA